MGRVRKLTVRNYRSIRDEIEVNFPENAPLLILGENNAGKSNIIRALGLILGEAWPGNYEPEDHEFHNRDKKNAPMQICVELDGVSYTDNYGAIQSVREITWQYPDALNRPSFRMTLGNGKKSQYISTAVREQCLCIVIGADRRLSYQLSYATKYTLLARLMNRFHKALTSNPDRVKALKEEFENVQKLFNGVEEFSIFSAELQRQVRELSNNMTYGLGVDFSAYDPSNYFHALHIYPQQGSQVRTFEELGTGQEQVLALCFANAYATAFHGDAGNPILVVEEPEVHLHPLAQKWVGQKIHELAKTGFQVVVTTHSPAFLDMLDLEGVAIARKDAEATSIVQLSRNDLAEFSRRHGAPKAEDDTVLPFYSAIATEEILSGFFARKVVLVEGPTESLALPVYLSRVGLDVTKEGVAIIPVHGVGNLAKWWRLFTAYNIPTYVLFDNDASDDPAGSKREDILEALGVPTGQHKELLNATSWVVETDFSVFGGNFESTLRASFGKVYGDLEQQAKNEYHLSANQSKPLIARYVAGSLDGSVKSVGWYYLDLIKQKIAQLGSLAV